MSHCCILIEGKLLNSRFIKPYDHQYLSENKGMSTTQETVKLLSRTNAILQRMGCKVF